jgi:hypothetical protein
MEGKQGMTALRKLLTPEDLAEYLCVRVRWVYDHTKGTCPDPIPHIKLGKYLRFNSESPEFLAWLNRQSNQAGVDND